MPKDGKRHQTAYAPVGLIEHNSYLVTLRGGSSNHRSQFKRLADGLPSLLRRRMLPKTMPKRQVQRRLTADGAVRMVAEYQAGDSMQTLAQRWTVTAHSHRAGIAVRQRGIPAERLDEVIRLYGEGWSCQRLAERYGCDGETVRQALKS